MRPAISRGNNFSLVRTMMSSPEQSLRYFRLTPAYLKQSNAQVCLMISGLVMHSQPNSQSTRQ